MHIRRLLPIVLAAAALVGCDGYYESRMVVSGDSASIASVSTAIHEYAAEHELSCSAHPGTAIYCERQPVTVFVTEEESAVVVCYLARGAQFESSKFASRIESLRSRIEAAVGQNRVRISGRKGSECLVPRA
jgi:hypothetical protein